MKKLNNIDHYIKLALNTTNLKLVKELNEELQSICNNYHDWNCTGCVVCQCERRIPNVNKNKYGCDCYMDGEKMRNYILKFFVDIPL